MSDQFQDYYSARVPEPWTILGLRLRPFSLGHLILLHRIQSGFVTESEITFEDLALSVLICAHPFKQACALFDEPDLEKFMGRWAKKLTGEGWRTRLGLRQVKPISLQANVLAFVSYMKADDREIAFDVGNGSGSALPSVQIVRVTLLRNFGGLTDEALMDRSWGLCMEDYLTIHALDGKTKIRDAGELDDAHEAGRKLHEELVAQGVIKSSPPKNGAR